MKTDQASGALGALVLPDGTEALVYDWTVSMTRLSWRRWNGSFTASAETARTLAALRDPVRMTLTDDAGLHWAGAIVLTRHPLAGRVIRISFDGVSPLTRARIPARLRGV